MNELHITDEEYEEFQKFMKEYNIKKEKRKQNSFLYRLYLFLSCDKKK